MRRAQSSLMGRQYKFWKELVTLLLATGVFLLCLFPYRALLNYYEQTHLFRWSAYYLREQCISIDGCVEYIISFITQFFYVGWAGAIIMALLAVAIQLLLWGLLRIIRFDKPICYPLTLIAPALLFYFVFIPSEYREEEAFRETVTYDYLVRAKKWNTILNKSYHHPPQTLTGIWCTNYALANKGILLDKMFLYKQDGPDGLLMDATRMEPLALFSLSDIAFELGMINSAERFAFDVKQRLPDYHKSGRIYRRLAECNLLNGHDKVARKYMKILQSTFFYKGWANKYYNYISNRKALAEDKHYGYLLTYRQKGNDELAQAKDQILAQMVKENPENKLASDYLLAYEMLRLDLKKVVEYTLLLNKDARTKLMPKSIQESISGYWILSHPNDSLPIPINRDVFSITESYLQTVKTTGDMLSPSLDVPPYSQSYWHYHFHSTVKLRQQK